MWRWIPDIFYIYFAHVKVKHLKTSSHRFLWLDFLVMSSDSSTSPSSHGHGLCCHLNFYKVKDADKNFAFLQTDNNWFLIQQKYLGITHAAVWAACCSFISHNTDAELRPSMQSFLQGIHHGFGRFCGAVFGGMLIKEHGKFVKILWTLW